MAENADIAAWITLFTGLYAIAAAIGELRHPGSWAAMLDDFEKKEGLRFVTGLILLALGAAIYLVNPWNPADWLSVVVTVLGGGMALEGLVMLAFGRAFMHFASGLLGTVNRFWALVAAVMGAVLVCVALIRF